MECDLSIEAVSLSRKHAIILVERGTHFVMDNGSRNKTFRGEVGPRRGRWVGGQCDERELVCEQVREWPGKA